MEQKIIQKASKDHSQIKNDVPDSTVQLSKTWVFWESYNSKAINLSYEDANKKIYKWNDIIAFFQFWNRYPGNDIKNIFFDENNIKYFFNEKYRINSMNIFVDGIKPMWEDPQNKGGKFLKLEYQIKRENMDEFCKSINLQWKKLALSTMGMNLPGAEYINGIRIIDKTDFDKGRKIMFRIEIWVSKNMEQNILEELKESLKKPFGCQNIVVKDID